MPISHAAAEIEPVARVLPSSAALPGPMRAPELRMRVGLKRAMPTSVPVPTGSCLVLTGVAEPQGSQSCDHDGRCPGSRHLSPHDPQAFTWLQSLAIAHFPRGDREEAARRVADTVAQRAEAPLGHCILACSLAESGRREGARGAFVELRQPTLAGTDGHDTLLRRFVGRADRDRILEALRRMERWQ
jgi:hypothetical protein